MSVTTKNKKSKKITYGLTEEQSISILTQSALQSALVKKINTDDLSSLESDPIYVSDKHKIPFLNSNDKVPEVYLPENKAHKEFVYRIDVSDINYTVGSLIINLFNLVDFSTDCTSIGIDTDAFIPTTSGLKALKFPTMDNEHPYTKYDITVRLTGSFDGSANTGREFKVDIRRPDATVIESETIMKVSDNSLTSKSAKFLTYTNGDSDPYINDGLVIAITNSTGSVVINGFQILIFGSNL